MFNKWNEMFYGYSWNGITIDQFIEELNEYMKWYGEKRINDLHGHSEGDKVLIKMAKKVESMIKKVDTFARWGGEEFVILLSRIDLEEAIIIAERIRESIMELDHGIGEEITISIGVTAFKEDDSVDSLFNRVDKALYEAKKTGRNKTVKIG